MDALLRCAGALALALAIAFPAAAAAWVAGVDVSALADVEAAGARFSDSTGRADPLQLLARHGIEEVRLRVFHRRTDPCCDPAQALALARRARAAGMSVYLDLHFSDTWADPGRQETPAAWRGARGQALEDSVFAWTRDVLRTFVAAGVVPRRVQLGNEITNGLLWEQGRVRGPGDRDPAGWRRLAALLAAARRGVESAGAAPSPRLVVHVDRGGDAAGAVAFFERLAAAGFVPDELAVSYYPWWHGDLDAFRATLRALVARFRRPVLVAETAFPWTFAWSDSVPNLVGPAARLPPGFDATPAGQAAFARAVGAAVGELPGGLGAGVFWWAPEEVGVPGRGSVWENCAWFDFAGRALPALDALRSAGAPAGAGR